MFKSKSKSHESDIHLKVLRFARDNPNGFRLEALKTAFPKDFNWIRREWQHDKVFSNGRPVGEIGDPILFLSFNDRFKLLEHEELQEARQSSRNALWVATISILIAIIAIIFQIITVQDVKVVNLPVHFERVGNHDALDDDACMGLIQ